MKIVECPICESKFDIANLPEGTKLRCGQCKRVFALVKDGEAVPYFEEVTLSPIAAPRKPKPKVEAEPEYEKVVIRRRAPVAEAEKLDPLLLVAGLIGVAAIITLIYTITECMRPVEAILRKERRVTRIEETSKKTGFLFPVAQNDHKG
ncbi:hypothetical protein ES703_81473 [subsurface metagenome]